MVTLKDIFGSSVLLFPGCYVIRLAYSLQVSQLPHWAMGRLYYICLRVLGRDNLYHVGDKVLMRVNISNLPVIGSPRKV